MLAAGAPRQCPWYTGISPRSVVPWRFDQNPLFTRNEYDALFRSGLGGEIIMPCPARLLSIFGMMMSSVLLSGEKAQNSRTSWC